MCYYYQLCYLLTKFYTYSKLQLLFEIFKELNSSNVRKIKVANPSTHIQFPDSQGGELFFDCLADTAEALLKPFEVMTSSFRQFSQP